MSPDVPDTDAPDDTTTDPDAPVVESPLLTDTTPLSPDEPADELPMDTEPDDDVALTPL
jgi:hypothetical protein